MPDAAELRRGILALIEPYFQANWPTKPFVPGESPVPVSGKVFDADDLRNLVDASLDFWLTTGRFADRFEQEFARVMGVRHALLVNSGSSANLLAMAALSSPLLKDRRLAPGDEVLTSAAGFPTTVNPILQCGLTPVFVDADAPTYNVNVRALETAVSKKTKAVFLAHTLGNPFDLDAVTALVRKHDLWLIEDACDSVGSTYRGRPVGSFGDLATVSFYPAHHMTMGEGGAVLTGDPVLRRIVMSLRDWGRDCWCPPGHDNTCGRRFTQKFGDLPYGYDHKYVYSHVGYNLKATDMQAAVGLSQAEKLPVFHQRRRENFAFLREALSKFQDVLVLPEATANSDPSWFGFPLSVRDGAPFDRNRIIQALEDGRIGTRLLFGGNLLRQPAYKDAPIRAAGPLAGADFITERAFWIGVYPGLTRAMLEFVVRTIDRFVASCR